MFMKNKKMKDIFVLFRIFTEFFIPTGSPASIFVLKGEGAEVYILTGFY